MAHNLIAVQEDLERQVADRTEDLQSVLIEVRMRSKALEQVNRELAEADRRKTEFLTNVSHELRTPLNAIIGFLSLLKDGLYKDEAERQEYLANAELCATHLLRTIVDVLSSARLEAGIVDVNVIDFDPGTVVQEVVDILALERSETPVVIRIENDGEPRVVADEVKLRQILINLVSNALKFTENGEVVIRVLPGEEVVVFEVEDSGAGIPAEEQERIFEKFHQVEGQRTHHQGGTGLGLAITRELVELMGGEIHAHSDGPGRGSIFRFTLPAVKSRQTVGSV
jgi:signal transduction histidine kinase